MACGECSDRVGRAITVRDDRIKLYAVPFAASPDRTAVHCVACWHSDGGAPRYAPTTIALYNALSRQKPHEARAQYFARAPRLILAPRGSERSPFSGLVLIQSTRVSRPSCVKVESGTATESQEPDRHNTACRTRSRRARRRRPAPPTRDGHSRANINRTSGRQLASRLYAMASTSEIN